MSGLPDEAVEAAIAPDPWAHLGGSGWRYSRDATWCILARRMSGQEADRVLAAIDVGRTTAHEVWKDPRYV